MNRIIILIILISLFSCRSQESETKSEALNNLNEIVKSNKSNDKTYSKLDSLKRIVDGADSELYMEVYKNAIIYDSGNFTKFYKKYQLDEDVISFFSQSKETLDSINLSIKKIYPKTLLIHDSDGFVNLRKKTNSQSEIIVKINSNERVNIIATANNWSKIYYNGNIGYIHNSKLFDSSVLDNQIFDKYKLENIINLDSKKKKELLTKSFIGTILKRYENSPDQIVEKLIFTRDKNGKLEVNTEILDYISRNTTRENSAYLFALEDYHQKHNYNNQMWDSDEFSEIKAYIFDTSYPLLKKYWSDKHLEWYGGKPHYLLGYRGAWEENNYYKIPTLKENVIDYIRYYWPED